jgi:hypothetical protein
MSFTVIYKCELQQNADVFQPDYKVLQSGVNFETIAIPSTDCSSFIVWHGYWY